MWTSCVQQARRSLSLKLSVAVASVVLVTVGLMSLYAYVQERGSAIQRELADLHALSKDLASQIDLSLAGGKILPAHLAATRNAQDFLSQSRPDAASRKTCQEWLDLQIRQTPGMAALFILSPTGECLASTSRKFIGHNYSFRPYFQEAAAGRPFLSDWSLGLLDRNPHIDSSAPVRRRGRVVGVLVTEFAVDRMEQAVRAAGGSGRTAMIINRAGIALAHSVPALQYHALKPLDASVLAELQNTRQFMGRDIQVNPASPEWTAGFRKAQVTSQQQTVAYREGTAAKWAVLTPLVEKDWVVSLAIPHAAILAPVRKAMGRTLLAGLAIALVGVLAAFAMGRSLTGSIHQLSGAMDRFGAGDTSARAPVLDPDERGQLSQAFNHMADALQSHQKRLEELQSQKLESLGTLVAGIAHNLNNVLVIALGTASLRGASAVEPADRQAYQHIVKVCRRGRDIVKSLINFARPTPATQAPIELNAVIREVCALLESTARARVRVMRALTEAPLWINGNAGDIDQILVNLGINALDAMPDQGTLTFRTAIVGADQVEVAIEDDGTGMAPEVLARALEPFYTTKEVGQGIGLGLSVTYGVVKAHGGSIDLASRPGQGTTVKLRFPRIPAPPQREAVPQPAAPLAFRKILLVDDEEDVRFLMTRMLRKAGADQVATAASGAEALEQLLAGDLPDVLILDQNMPGMTGAQVMAEVRSRHPELPILISSGQPDIENWACFQKPRMGVISKPFTLGEIQAKLAQFAGGPPAPGRTPPAAAP